MGHSVFEFIDYKTYLKDCLPTHGDKRGIRSRLARAIRCKPAFVTQVLNGQVHLSLEHAIDVDRFLSHTSQETQYFMLLVYKDRAGSKALETFYSEQLELIRRERSRVANQVRANTVDKDETDRYYATWIYSAIHTLLMVPGISKEAQVSERLGLSLDAVVEAVEFLTRIGLVQRTAGKLVATNRRVHLDDRSLMIHKHHANWRIRSLHALDSHNPLNLRYSGPVALSKKNAQKVRELLLGVIRNLEPILSESDEEEIYGIALDFFLL